MIASLFLSFTDGQQQMHAHRPRSIVICERRTLPNFPIQSRMDQRQEIRVPTKLDGDVQPNLERGSHQWRAQKTKDIGVRKCR